MKSSFGVSHAEQSSTAYVEALAVGSVEIPIPKFVVVFLNFFRFSEFWRHFWRCGYFRPLPSLNRVNVCIQSLWVLKIAFMQLMIHKRPLLWLYTTLCEMIFIRLYWNVLLAYCDQHELWVSGTKCRVPDAMSDNGQNFVVVFFNFFRFSEFWRHFWRCGYFRPPPVWIGLSHTVCCLTLFRLGFLRVFWP